MEREWALQFLLDNTEALFWLAAPWEAGLCKCYVFDGEAS